MIFWSLVIGLPLLAYGGALFFCSEGVKRFSHWFENSRAVAAALTIPAWFWTAYECHIIGIDVFDRYWIYLMKKLQEGEIVHIACGIHALICRIFF